ncbi:unnamed protein product, partial [Polarella glacialis]
VGILFADSPNSSSHRHPDLPNSSSGKSRSPDLSLCYSESESLNQRSLESARRRNGDWSSQSHRSHHSESLTSFNIEGLNSDDVPQNSSNGSKHSVAEHTRFIRSARSAASQEKARKSAASQEKSVRSAASQEKGRHQVESFRNAVADELTRSFQ